MQYREKMKIIVAQNILTPLVDVDCKISFPYTIDIPSLKAIIIFCLVDIFSTYSANTVKVKAFFFLQ